MKVLLLLALLAPALEGQVRDTAVMTATYTVRPGIAIDSIRLRFAGPFTDSLSTFRPPFPSSVTHRHIIPLNAYPPAGSPGPSLFDVSVQFHVFRPGRPVEIINGPVLTMSLLPLPEPPTIGGIGFTAVKRP